MITEDEFLTLHLPRGGGKVGPMAEEVVARARIQLKKRELRGSIQRYLEWAEKEATEARERLLSGADMSSVGDQLTMIRDYGVTLASLRDRYQALEDLG